MDVDDEITQISNTPLSKLDPSIPVFQPNKSKVRFQNPSKDSHLNKEKLPKKIQLENPLSKEYPDIKEKLASRILAEQQMFLPLGEPLAAAPGVAESFK
ncbi:uncharacterized protein VP01_1889g3 [Puccinia sorghi]|uniref:Uncharacterized protein n=1 Tax=Puccinia sorghi TaxID=27349 RepID=A0A0L6VCY4_9BASI|nr:uncharacterized protein VP01_1889g3 [Puccinia sorghi]